MSRATNFVKATYQEIYDIGTQSERITVLGIHTPQPNDTGNSYHSKLYGLFFNYRKFRYAGCSVSIIPAAQLPADPLQVSYEAGETIDPRDLLNPIMFHGTHGASLSQALNRVFVNTATPTYTDNDDGSLLQQSFLNSQNVPNNTVTPNDLQYYACMSDPTWKKWNVQQGAKLPFMSPRVWKASTVFPIMPQDGNAGNGLNSVDYGKIDTQGRFTDGLGFSSGGLTVPVPGNPVLSADTYNQFLSSGTTRLGWLPTYGFMNAQQSPASNLPRTLLPKIFMGIIMLPPSYKQELYFRVIVQHYFEFKDFSAGGLSWSTLPLRHGYYNWLPASATGTALSIDAMEGEEIPVTEIATVPDDETTIEAYPSANIRRADAGVF